MKNSLVIGSAPYAEDCSQVGSDHYLHNANVECLLFIAQLHRQFGYEPRGTRLYVKENPHDFGTYLHVECEFDDEDGRSSDYAFACESECWQQWDEIAKENLKRNLKGVNNEKYQRN